MKLRFTRRAVDNIAELADYIRARNPEAAQAVREAIYDSLEKPSAVSKRGSLTDN